MKKLALLILLLLTMKVCAQSTLQWPFDQTPPATLRQMPQKVFIHYFGVFPVSIDNKDGWSGDYYEKGYLNPYGEGDKHHNYGGYLRQRPLPRIKRTESDWYITDMKKEIQQAAALGADGFSYDMLSSDPSSILWRRLQYILQAANELNNGFKILLMPDMAAGFKTVTAAYMADVIATFASDSAVYRLDDGRLVVAPFNGQSRPVSFWEDFQNEMNQRDIDFVLWPTFQGWWNYIEDYAPVSYGVSDWGVATIIWQPSRAQGWATQPHWGLEVMAPVRPQDSRPKDQIGFEGGNSALFRAQWDTAMNDADALWAQIITWNDYSEASEIEPSTCTRYAFYDLAAYYISWFKTQQQPSIVRDALYYFYRTQPTDANPSSPYQTEPFSVYGDAQNQIELLGFLTEPGTLEITIDGQTYSSNVSAGIQSLSVPLANGVPEFKITRNGQTVMQRTGNWEITDQIVYSNLLVHADGGTSEQKRVYLELGPVIQNVADYDSTCCNVIVGDPAAVHLPQTQPPYYANLTESQMGAWTMTIGPGTTKTDARMDFGDNIQLLDGQEVVFHVNRVELDGAGGWVANFLSIKNGNGRRINIVLSNPTHAYVSSSLPSFAVETNPFPVTYPAVYRIRKVGDTLAFVYNDTVVYTADATDSAGLDKIDIYMGAAQAAAKSLVEIQAIDVRESQ